MDIVLNIGYVVQNGDECPQKRCMYEMLKFHLRLLTKLFTRREHVVCLIYAVDIRAIS